MYNNYVVITMETWHFGSNNDNLIKLVLSGDKTATTSLYKEYIDEKEPLPKTGDMGILVFDNEKKACITKDTQIIVTEFKNITSDLACLEGEGDKSLEYYRKIHTDFFKKIDKNFNDNSLVVFEIFEVVEDLTKKRLDIAKTIVDNNIDLFGNNEHNIYEINAGFNNDIFSVDEKFIIKICTNDKLEDTFEEEYKYYSVNRDSKYLPKLYKYDNSKKVVNYVYEIIEKINGKSLYYYWYKMTESQREECIKELVKMLKSIHKIINSDINWTHYIKSKVKECFNKTRKYFDLNNQKIILDSINLYDKYLTDNRFSFIHNDFHFDNILYYNGNYYLIDFNDSMIAPFDYDLRILYMCKDTPHKWANIEMDPYQKKDDYKNIFKYIKKYYTELNNVKFLEERMIIYRILNDIELLTKYNNQELKDNIIKYSSELLEKK